MSLESSNEDKIKVNTDSVIFEASNYYSYSMVRRIHNGELIEVSSKCVLGNVTSEMAEAMDIREALSWLKNQHN